MSNWEMGAREGLCFSYGCMFIGRFEGHHWHCIAMVFYMDACASMREGFETRVHTAQE